jgi:hypothetical protein
VRRAERPAARGQDSDDHRDDRHGRRGLCRGAAAEPVKSEVIMHGKASGIEGIKDPGHRIRQFFLSSALAVTCHGKCAARFRHNDAEPVVVSEL